MTHSITLNNETISYTLRMSARAKHLRFTLHPDGRFVVSAPARMSVQKIELYLVQKADWIVKKRKEINVHAPVVRNAKQSKAHFLKHKAAALERATMKVAHFNQCYKFTFGTITIRNQKTRWGSCSKKGNLNFNYKIALLPEVLADYLVVHELCHLGAFNHSKKFWNLVARMIPNYKELRKELRKTILRFQ
ncbi:M48 family metallopeptidase [Candidatus Uhrbacteria bacterium]|nr:M48 family metallopeptidase [Candidatus Uhrbacteria bacterium]